MLKVILPNQKKGCKSTIHWPFKSVNLAPDSDASVLKFTLKTSSPEEVTIWKY